MHFRYVFENTYSDEANLKQQVRNIQEQVEKEKMKAIALEDATVDFKNQVAALKLPQEVLKKQAWLESLREPASIKKIELSGVLFEEGSDFFKNEKYADSLRVFKKLIEKYPVSEKAIESRFLMVESEFRLGKFNECLDMIDEMITHFPEQKLTGFVMLRMSQILKARNKNQEALEVLKIVKKKFADDRALVSQAESLMKVVEK